MADIQYPVSKETLHKYAQDIFKPIRRGECVTTVWPPMAGRRKLNKFIIENISLFENELPNYQKYLPVYIEPLDLAEESLTGYLRLMAKSFVEVCEKNPEKETLLDRSLLGVFDDKNADYSSLFEGLKKLLFFATKNGNNVIFFVGEFDELSFANRVFFNNLKSLWSGLYPRLHYVFLVKDRVLDEKNIALWGELNEAVLQNIVYVPILKDLDIDFMINRLANEYDWKPDEKQTLELKKLCGGHPYMLKTAFRIMSQVDEKGGITEILNGNYELKSVARGIFSQRPMEEREILVKVANSGKTESASDESFKFLKEMGYIKSLGDGKFTLFGSIFEDEVKGSDSKKAATSKNGQALLLHDEKGVIFGETPLENILTRQEYSVLSSLIQKKDVLFTRDDIGGILWGKDSYEKFSDWAIDQLISKLRKKLLKLGVKEKITTLRGRGYKLTSE